MVLLISGVLPGWAADLVLTSSATTLAVGQPVSIQVAVAAPAPAINIAQVRIDFDRTRLALVSVAAVNPAADLVCNEPPAVINGTGSLKALVDLPGNAGVGAGAWLTVTFTALASGSATVTARDHAQPYGARLFDTAYAEVLPVSVPDTSMSIAITAASGGSGGGGTSSSGGGGGGGGCGAGSAALMLIGLVGCHRLRRRS
jgi:uncharacterized membrane protein YgcG